MYSESITKTIQYEVIQTLNKNFPFKLVLHENNTASTGCQFHWHEQIEFYYVLKGGVSLICNGKQDLLLPGDIGFINYNHPHRSTSFLEDTQHYIIQVDLSLLCTEPYTSLITQPSHPISPFIKNDIILNSIFDSIIKEYLNKNIGYELEVRALMLKLFSRILRMNPHTKSSIGEPNTNTHSLQHIHNILHYISLNYTTYISLHDISHELGLSIPYMCRLFKKNTNLTILSYINELKCNHAASLIIDGVPLSDVYSEVGYSDYNYFSRLFKKYFEVSPSAYKLKGHE